MMLSGIKSLKRMFSPGKRPSEKPSSISIRPIEAWEYLLSRLPYSSGLRETSPVPPSPTSVLEYVGSLFRKFGSEAKRELNYKCSRGAGTADLVASILAILEKATSVFEILKRELDEGKDFSTLMDKAKRVGEGLSEKLIESSNLVIQECRKCYGLGSPKACCDLCKKIADELHLLAIDVRPLLDTCYDSRKAKSLFERLKMLVEETERRKNGLGVKLVSIIISVIALEIAEGVGEELTWLLNLVIQSLGLEKWLWHGDLAAILYAANMITGIPESVEISNNEATEVVTTLLGL